jgi:hypothetical protein
MLVSGSAADRVSTAAPSRRRRLWRSRAERAADKAEARLRQQRARTALVAERHARKAKRPSRLPKWWTELTAEDRLTRVAAVIATAVSAQGMWRFAGDVLHLDGALRVALFAFIEVAVITSAVRARRNMQTSAARTAEHPWERPSAGIDGTAVWALTCLTAVLSSMDARSAGEFVFRLAAPLVAAWLWERGMAIERVRLTGRARIHWRFTLERILVRLGLAEASERTAGEVTVQRLLTRVALAADRAHQLRAAQAWKWRQKLAYTRLRRAFTRAGRHTELASDLALQQTLETQVAALRSVDGLLDVDAASAWTKPKTPPRGALPPAADELNNALARWSKEFRNVAHIPGDRSHDQNATTTATRRSVIPPLCTSRPEDPFSVGVRVPLNHFSRPVVRPADDREGLREVVAAVVAELDARPVADPPDSRPVGDQERDQKRPTEQDKARVVRLWVNRVRRGEVWSKRELSDRTGFRETWCLDRIREGRDLLAAEGWTFDESGQPVPPVRPVATTPQQEAVADVVANASL